MVSKEVPRSNRTRKDSEASLIQEESWGREEEEGRNGGREGGGRMVHILAGG